MPTELSGAAQQALDNMSTAVLVFDDALRLIYMNPAAEVLISSSLRRANGTSAQTLFPGEAELVSSLERTLLTGQEYAERERTIRLPDMQSVTVDCIFTPLTMRGKKNGVLLELNSLERHKRISREESLITQHQITKTVMRGLAHEINNPLGGLRGAAQLLSRELPSESLKEYTNIIIGEADRLQNLLARILGPNKVPKKKWINIHEVMEHVRKLVTAEAENIRIVQDYDPSIPELFADSDQLIQALLNIVRNAVQALNGKGEIVLSTRVMRYYTIGSKQHKLVVRIDITDKGPGIPEDMIEKIFFPMVTGRAEGTGLGLSISQSIINSHNGIIECESKKGITKFSIIIPMETIEDEH